MAANKRTASSNMALGGIMAALAVVIMCMGGMIPAATFVCPMVCMLMLVLVLERCGARTAWTWYASVAILSLLMSPDKEAGAVFLALGYYPVIKPKMDRLPLRWLWKILFFNAVILALYWALMNLLGMAELLEEFREMGQIMTVVTLVLGNVTFLMLDKLLVPGLFTRRKHGK